MNLAELRVLDLGTAVAGPYAAGLLADLGAQVIKIEKPRRGDSIRFADRHVQGECGYFLGVNRGKRSMTLDLRKPEGAAILKQLAAEADVLVENFRPGTMQGYGLGHDQLKAVNPRLIYCSITAFPKVRGLEEASGNDITVQAYSGLMDMTGYADAAPAKIGVPVVDTGTSMLATIGILAALARRVTTGVGEHVAVSLLEGAFALMPNFVTTELNTEHRFTRLDSGHPQIVPYEAFMCADGAYLVVGAFHREMWAAMCRVLELEQLRDDPRFVENFDRVQNRKALIPLLQKEMLRRDRDDWMPRFFAADVPCAPIFSIREALEHFTANAPELVHEVEHAKIGPLRMLRNPIQFHDAPITPPRRSAPLLGADTEALLAHIGYSSEQYAELRQRGIV